jgi:hypothetical protein
VKPSRSICIVSLLLSLPILLLPIRQCQAQTFDTKVITKAISPDKRFTAELMTFIYNGQVMAGPSFSIHKNGSNESLVVFELSDVQDVQITWESNSRVVVSVPVGSKINWHGVLPGYPHVYITSSGDN